MATCKLSSYAVPIDHPAGASRGRAVTWCETHMMELPRPQAVGSCPLGQIEDATDRAIGRLQAEAVALSGIGSVIERLDRLLKIIEQLEARVDAIKQ